ncbi:CdaR family transcriptional regulator [Pseudalkalibacillus hwajinpoensis]|uniref:CdaR family transcriptional regulator n=1 Tax=Guptibacillus hwajinpoensis TaxID=208199 RepID=UPI001CD786D3|nr:sugar diacid recognition domain-containing protein [Pseudalkalibacillus hwajinpoensis]MCA0991575.1 helix-turn-helix domain-containing protein [Pseudalkalibacillus hwajinpoensis]
MIISPPLAQSIVEETEGIISRNINFMDGEGKIIASTDPNRIGHFHEGAYNVLQQQRSLVIEEDNELEGTRKGINLPVFLHDQIIGVIGITGEPEEIKQMGEVIQKMTEILVKEAYLDEQLELEDRAKEAFIDEWIDGKWDNDKLFASRGWILGINVHIPRVAVILDMIGMNDLIYEKLSSYQADVKGELEIQRFRRAILQEIQSRFPPNSQHVIIPTGSTRYTLLLSVNDQVPESNRKRKIQFRLEQIQQAIESTYPFTMAAGIGRMYNTPREISKSVQESEKALLHSRKQSNLFFYDQLGIESFLYDLSPEVRLDFVERILPLERVEKKDQLIQTLETFYKANGSIQKASSELFIHKNTLQYRLKKISEWTGYDPRNYEDSVLLQVALAFYKSNPV